MKPSPKSKKQIGERGKSPSEGSETSEVPENQASAGSGAYPRRKQEFAQMTNASFSLLQTSNTAKNVRKKKGKCRAALRPPEDSRKESQPVRETRPSCRGD